MAAIQSSAFAKMWNAALSRSSGEGHCHAQMVFTLQLPLADLRPFLLEETGLLPLPQWPTAVPDTDFVRGFGAVRRRLRGGLNGWVGENVICEACNAAKFPSFPRRLVLKNDGIEYPGSQRIIFRRLYADGMCVAKFEAGCKIQLDDLVYPPTVINHLFEHICKVRVSITTGNSQRKNVSLIEAGNALAQSYLNATTSTSRRNDSMMQSWWVGAAAPMIVIDRSFYEQICLPYPAKSLPLQGCSGSSVSLIHIPLGGRHIETWILDSADADNSAKEKLREFRICLLRLHAEREILRKVLRTLAAKKVVIPAHTPSTDKLQRYLIEAIRRLTGLTKTATTIADSDLAPLVREIGEAFAPGERDALLQTVENLNMRLAVKRETANFIDSQIVENQYNYFFMNDQRTQISGGQQGAVGPGASASNNVFNQWSQSINGADLATLGEQLASLRGEMKQHSSTPEHDIAIGVIAEAETAAKKGDGPKTFESLKRAGTWALDLAKEVGVSMAAEALKQAVGM